MTRLELLVSQAWAEMEMNRGERNARAGAGSARSHTGAGPVKTLREEGVRLALSSIPPDVHPRRNGVADAHEK